MAGTDKRGSDGFPKKGRIIKAISGFYYVYTEDELLRQCRARGLFKLKGLSLLVGDYVTYSPVGEREGVIEEVAKRSSVLVRPPVANVDQVLLVFSVQEPAVTLFQLDKMAAMVERQGLSLALVFTKTDLPGAQASLADLMRVYEPLYPMFATSVKTGAGLDGLVAYMAQKTTALAGLSGVGKSSLLGHLVPDATVVTGEVSKRSQRGRHTTRHVELFFGCGGMIVDTPGFSQYSFADAEPEDAQAWFRELAVYAADCEFRGCLHESEQGCAVRAARAAGSLAQSRYANYLQLLAEIKQLKAKRYT